MGKSIKQLIGSLPKARRDRIEREAEALAAEMITEYESLEALRKAYGKTQHQLAASLGIGQNAVSQMERRADLYVSTLRKYVQALGGELEIAFKTKEGARVVLKSLHPWRKPSEGAVSSKKAARVAASTKRKATGPQKRQSAKGERRVAS